LENTGVRFYFENQAELLLARGCGWQRGLYRRGGSLSAELVLDYTQLAVALL